MSYRMRSFFVSSKRVVQLKPTKEAFVVVLANIPSSWKHQSTRDYIEKNFGSTYRFTFQASKQRAIITFSHPQRERGQKMIDQLDGVLVEDRILEAMWTRKSKENIRRMKHQNCQSRPSMKKSRRFSIKRPERQLRTEKPKRKPTLIIPTPPRPVKKSVEILNYEEENKHLMMLLREERRKRIETEQDKKEKEEEFVLQINRLSRKNELAESRVAELERDLEVEKEFNGRLDLLLNEREKMRESRKRKREDEVIGGIVIKLEDFPDGEPPRKKIKL